MKNRFSINKRNPRQLFFVVGAFCAYGLLVAGLIVLSAGNPLAQGKAALGTAAIGLPASGTGPASKPASPSTAAFPIQELHHKAKGLPVELFDDLN